MATSVKWSKNDVGLIKTIDVKPMSKIVVFVGWFCGYFEDRLSGADSLLCYTIWQTIIILRSIGLGTQPSIFGSDKKTWRNLSVNLRLQDIIILLFRHSATRSWHYFDPSFHKQYKIHLQPFKYLEIGLYFCIVGRILDVRANHAFFSLWKMTAHLNYFRIHRNQYKVIYFFNF